MAELLIRDLQEEALQRLADEAAATGQSIEEEARHLLNTAIRSLPPRASREEFWALADAIRERTRGSFQDDSGELRRLSRRGDD